MMTTPVSPIQMLVARPEVALPIVLLLSSQSRRSEADWFDRSSVRCRPATREGRGTRRVFVASTVANHALVRLKDDSRDSTRPAIASTSSPRPTDSTQRGGLRQPRALTNQTPPCPHSPSPSPPQPLWSRRLLLSLSSGALLYSATGANAATTDAAGTSPVPPTQAPPPAADAPTQFLRAFGIGDSDLFYPRFFEGTWICSSTLISVDLPQGEEVVDLRSVESARKQMGYTVEYRARFLPLGGYVVGDRAYTTKSLVEATVGEGAVRDVRWDSGKPNKLALQLQGGLKVETLITKRSQNRSVSGQFTTSEYSKQVFDNPDIVDGPPTVKASRNLTRYIWDPTEPDPEELEAFQVVSMYAVPGGQEGDGMLNEMDMLSAMAKPITTYKYLVRFKRDNMDNV